MKGLTKKVAALLGLAAVAVAAYALQEIPTSSAVRTSGTYTSSDMYVRDGANSAKDVGVIVTPVISAATGSTTITFTIEGKTPQGTYWTVLESAPAASTTTLSSNLVVAPGVKDTANASLPTGMPPVFRVKSTVAGTGSVTYSIGVSRVTN